MANCVNEYQLYQTDGETVAIRLYQFSFKEDRSSSVLRVQKEHQYTHGIQNNFYSATSGDLF